MRVFLSVFLRNFGSHTHTHIGTQPIDIDFSHFMSVRQPIAQHDHNVRLLSLWLATRPVLSIKIRVYVLVLVYKYNDIFNSQPSQTLHYTTDTRFIYSYDYSILIKFN